MGLYKNFQIIIIQYLKENINGYKRKGKEYFYEYVNNYTYIFLEFQGEYLLGKKYNGKVYDKNGSLLYELKNGNRNVKEYKDGNLIFEGEYLNGFRHEKEKNIIAGINRILYLMVYIQKEKD